MAEIINEIDEKLYLGGFLLREVIFQFGNSELIAALNQIANTPISRAKAGNIKEVLQSAVSSLQTFQNSRDQHGKIIEALKADILAQIKKGDLIPYGFIEPQAIYAKPIKIPANLFFTGQLNWDNSELKNKSHEFSGIRLLSNLIPAIDNQPNKPKKKSFADLDPEIHIDEIKAADYLGISRKTLQGYRVKGGGPEYRIIGERSVRYKVADLVKWAESKKKRNTSE